MQNCNEERSSRRSTPDTSLAKCHGADNLKLQTKIRNFDLETAPCSMRDLTLAGHANPRYTSMSPTIKKGTMPRSASHDNLFFNDEIDNDVDDEPTTPPAYLPRSKSYTCLATLTSDEEIRTPPSTPPVSGSRPSSLGKWMLQSMKNAVRPKKNRAVPPGISSSDGRMHGSEGGHIDMF
jgi:hypothetical protein